MKSRNVVFEDGLSDSEVEHTELRFGFRFPPDLKALLQTALPLRIASDQRTNAFCNWRSADEEELQQRLDWPFEGMAFDIENNVFRLDEWGTKPDRLEHAIEVARQAVAAAPKMIPIYSHRYLPAEPHLARNLVFSIHQTDIIFYGCDLWDYFINEFAPESERWQRRKAMSADEYAAAHRTIPFWSALVG